MPTGLRRLEEPQALEEQPAAAGAENQAPMQLKRIEDGMSCNRSAGNEARGMNTDIDVRLGAASIDVPRSACAATGASNRAVAILGT